VISLLSPFIGLRYGFLVYYVVCERFGRGWARGAEAGILTLVGFVLLGLLCAVASLARSEKVWGITAVGLLLNGGLLAFYGMKMTGY
jgi:hypothetical protein